LRSGTNGDRERLGLPAPGQQPLKPVGLAPAKTMRSSTSVSHASDDHRLFDAAFAEAVARDRACDGSYRTALSRAGGKFQDMPPRERTADGDPPAYGGALLPSRLRNQDLKTMIRPRVLLATLSVRTSAKGNSYLSGWFGKASVVGFAGEPDKHGNQFNSGSSYASREKGAGGARPTCSHRPKLSLLYWYAG
jgi:hypothetical protein